MLKRINAFIEKIGIKFENKDILLNAFVHRSFLNEHKNFYLPSNEKLEFLGDSVLSLITSFYLFKKYPTLHEGDYTNIKASLVKTETLAKIARKLGLGNFLLLSKGEEKNNGRENQSILADCFEALIGSIFLDQGFEKAYNFVKIHLLVDNTESLVKKHQYSSAKNRLQEYFQNKFKVLPNYVVIKEFGPQHKKKYIVSVNFKNKTLAVGQGKSKKQAEEIAAKYALQKLRI